MSHVEIAIGDTRGNRIVLPRATWTAFVEKKIDIERLVQSTAPSSLVIQNFVIELVKIRDVDTVKLSLCDKCLYMKPSTMLFMFELEQCVEHVYFDLCQFSNSVSDKFKYIITYLRQNCIMNKCDAINILRKIYDKNSHIECELILYASHNIVYHALRECNKCLLIFYNTYLSIYHYSFHPFYAHPLSFLPYRITRADTRQRHRARIKRICDRFKIFASE
ncbi:hypothetical protein ALC60_13767 [Trachymyrmex zeteki]|uniref:Uncharacterized protein n=1 Tax=Mycetomoellerius zeteki TaxID=64791 RepID=A0A151WHA7_9HYME|nr:hypothetical protein ALC60_13767 [Trachymyrmex zeteki]